MAQIRQHVGPEKRVICFVILCFHLSGIVSPKMPTSPNISNICCHQLSVLGASSEVGPHIGNFSVGYHWYGLLNSLTIGKDLERNIDPRPRGLKLVAIDARQGLMAKQTGHWWHTENTTKNSTVIAHQLVHRWFNFNPVAISNFEEWASKMAKKRQGKRKGLRMTSRNGSSCWRATPAGSCDFWARMLSKVLAKISSRGFTVPDLHLKSPWAQLATKCSCGRNNVSRSFVKILGSII